MVFFELVSVLVSDVRVIRFVPLLSLAYYDLFVDVIVTGLLISIGRETLNFVHAIVRIGLFVLLSHSQGLPTVAPI